MRKAAVFVLGLGLLAAACGDTGQPRADPAAPEATAARPSGDAPASAQRKGRQKLVDPRAGGFEVGFGEYAITTEAKAIRPGEVTFVVRNGGKLTHGLELESESEAGSNSGHGGGDVGYKVEEPTFAPGDSFELTLTLAPGIYELECYVGNHEELGMRSVLRVSGDARLVRPAADPSGNTVDIEGFAFGPRSLEVPAGTDVTWRNADPTEHTVTSKDGSFGSDPLAESATFSVTFDQPGEYRYFCAIHPSMEGVIRVTG